MRREPSPYRFAQPHAPPERRNLDPLLRAQRSAAAFVIGWSILRVAICSVRGLDLEGCIALVILARSFA